MSEAKDIGRTLTGRPTVEGAGVILKRVFGYHEVPLLDPFLLFDDFGSTRAEDYIAGFPRHPHRGIETVTYMLHGTVKHGDSLGNAGEIGDGRVQWMTAGSGIIHQEMPQRQKDYLRGFQLWVNLPAKRKMMGPRYQDVTPADIPVVREADGTEVKVIAGKYGKAQGPVKDIICDPEYLDIRVPGRTRFLHEVKKGHTHFVYVLEGMAAFDRKGTRLTAGQLGLYGDGRDIAVETGTLGVRFVSVSGKPLGEPVAWRGPIVMNSEAELDLAFEEYREGRFIK